MKCYVAAKQRFDKRFIVKTCNCLPDCASIVYEAEISRSPYVHYLDEKRTDNRRFLYNRTGWMTIRRFIYFLHVFFSQTANWNAPTCVYPNRFPVASAFLLSFKEDHFILVNRSESLTMSEFISNCGSLLGLTMGISVLSIVEMIYYFTLRFYCKWKQQKKVQPTEQTQTVSKSFLK